MEEQNQREQYQEPGHERFLLGLEPETEEIPPIEEEKDAERLKELQIENVITGYKNRIVELTEQRNQLVRVVNIMNRLLDYLPSKRINDFKKTEECKIFREIMSKVWRPLKKELS